MNFGDEYNPYRLFVGAFIPNWLLCRTEISPGAKLCFARLCQFAGEQGECFPSQSKLCEELGTSDRQVKRYIVELKEAGLIKVVQQGLNRPNIYRFLYHEWMDSRIRVSDRTDMTLPDRTDMALQEGTKMALQEGTKMALPINIEENQLRESIKTDRLTAADKVKLTPSKRSVSQSVSFAESLFSMCKVQNKSIRAVIDSAIKRFGTEYADMLVRYCNDKCKNLKSYRGMISKALEAKQRPPDHKDYAQSWQDDQLFKSDLDQKQKEALEKKKRSESETAKAQLIAEEAEAERRKQKKLEIKAMIESLPADQIEALKTEFMKSCNVFIKKLVKKEGFNSFRTQIPFHEFIEKKMMEIEA